MYAKQTPFQVKILFLDGDRGEIFPYTTEYFDGYCTVSQFFNSIYPDLEIIEAKMNVPVLGSNGKI